jgi:hypothetical protein
MWRVNIITFGAVAVILAVMAAVIWNPAVGGPVGFALFVVAVSVFRVSRNIRASAARDGLRERVPDEGQMIGRYGPSDDGPQLAGSKCAYCDQKILTAVEATACRVCNAPVHVRCRKDHRVDAHRPESGVPYR